MEIIRGDGTLLNNIDLAPANVYQEVLQNIAVILDLVQKTAPMLRDVGIPGELYGRPLPVVENILVGAIYDQIEEYEPRAILGGVTFEREDLTGRLIPIIELEGVREIE
ncbi:hypothetical protein ADH76_09975 [Enterocloster clostridioformis]|uniref:hypothetical protein n=1 Tax=Enterocloster clostridioformis TaxID=1531 RepID=UPI00080C9314|nr:hypothetical protein [Enterocloster clostridioformis]ANU48518.1 hypothetical protein A4V08_24625 [Lachnoclostridium sp. YL32]NDO29217.1 hypothetical protein [Enterocloster clostridioformis]OXE68777.1 hypothetical protein ADH76_09975 [Enterocloster clostridioformis]QQR02592.1 hypothetical protein I5Q83_10150 [Enterocloster clostridioformis]